MKVSEQQLMLLLGIVQDTVTNQHINGFHIGRMSMVDRANLLNTIRNQSNEIPVDIGHQPTEV